MNSDTHRDHAGACFVCAASQRDDAAPDSPRDPARRGVLKAALAASLLAPLGAAAGGRGPAEHSSAWQALRNTHQRFVIDAGQALLERNGKPEIARDVSIVVNGSTIEDVVTGRQRGALSGIHRVDARGDFVSPGFISGHTHAAGGTTTRGIIEAGRSFARPLELVEALSDEEIDALTAFNVAELLRSGCTTHVEQSLSLRQAESYVRIAKRFAARGYPGGMIPGIARLFPIWFRPNDQALFDSVPGTLAEIQANLEFGRRNNGIEDGRIRPMMAPHATDTQTPETMRAIAAAAAELGNGVHIHLAQSANETNTVRRLWGVTPAQWCADLGLMDGPFFGAHMSGLDFAVDPPVLNAHGAVYSHCPSAGGAGGGTQPYPEALASGMNVNIGIDTHSNDYVENLKLAVLYGQARHSLIAATSPVPLRRPDMWMAIDGATRVAAAGLRRGDLGRIAPGAKADLVTIDVSGPLVGTGTLPPEPLNNLLYAHGLSVRHVFTDGRVQVYEGRFVAEDFARISREAGAAVQRLWGLLEAEGWFG
jgi:cytosine/adenosine deaminase-related metal-dependent hydrolase